MCNRRYGFENYLVYVKTMRTIAQIFVAFSEKLNFPTFFFILQSTSDNLYFFFQSNWSGLKKASILAKMINNLYSLKQKVVLSQLEIHVPTAKN